MAETPFQILGRELEAAARRQIAARPPERRIRRPHRTLLIAAVVAVGVLGAGAWAASSLLSVGTPIPYAYGPPVSGYGLGTPRPGSVVMLGTVPDPAGGPAWGLRSFTTSRGFACTQIGRLYRGQLGYIDGRVFHALRPGVVSDRGSCIPLDGAGHGFLSVHLAALARGGDPRRCGLAARRSCSAAAVRTVDFGLLGPRATRVSYRAGTTTRTTPTLGPDGGYLIVQRSQFAHPKTTGPFTATDPVLGAIGYRPQPPVLASVTYGATTCPVTERRWRSPAPVGACHFPPGFVPIPQPTVRDVRSHVTVTRVGPHALRVRFVARHAVTSERSAYAVAVGSTRIIRRCHCPGTLVTYSVDHDVRVGTVVTKTVHVAAVPHRRPPRYWVSVTYRNQTPTPSAGGAFNLTYPGTLVGRTSITVP